MFLLSSFSLDYTVCKHASLWAIIRYSTISEAYGKSSHSVHLMKDEPLIECTGRSESCICSWTVETACCFLLLLDKRYDCDGLRAESYGFMRSYTVQKEISFVRTRFPPFQCGFVFNLLYSEICCLCIWRGCLFFFVSSVWVMWGQSVATGNCTQVTWHVLSVKCSSVISSFVVFLSWHREKLPCRCSISPLRVNSTRVTSPIMARHCM